MRCLFPAKNRYAVNWLPERSTKTVEDCSHTQLLIFRVLTTNEQTNGFFSVHTCIHENWLAPAAPWSAWTTIFNTERPNPAGENYGGGRQMLSTRVNVHGLTLHLANPRCIARCKVKTNCAKRRLTFPRCGRCTMTSSYRG